MAYKVVVSPRAQKEIENAVEYYALYSNMAPAKFIYSLQEAYVALEIDPYLRLRYKHIRSIKLKKFPYSLYFLVNEDEKLVRILSCFHDKRNPKSRP